MPPLTEHEALVAYATMLNRADPSTLEPLLAEEFRLTSQSVLEDLVGKDAFLDYMVGKFEAMRKSGMLPRADLARRCPNAGRYRLCQRGRRRTSRAASV